MFLPYKLVLAGENGKDSYFIKRANFWRREWKRFQCSWTFFFLVVFLFAVIFPFRVLWNFAGASKERSVMLAVGIIPLAHSLYV